jgi:hypothetical protein
MISVIGIKSMKVLVLYRIYHPSLISSQNMINHGITR